MKLIIFIGCSGSGKTYFANKFLKNHPDWVIISSDDFRLERDGKINFLHKPVSTFNTVDELVLDALKDGKNVIYDACNLTRFRRGRLFSRLYNYRRHIKVIGVVFHTRFKTCVKQDKSKLRKHHVGKYNIFLMKILSYMNTPKMTEGFSILTTPKSLHSILK